MAWQTIHQFNDGTAAQLDPSVKWRLSDITLNDDETVHAAGCLICCVAMMKKHDGDARCAYDIVYDLAKNHTSKSNGNYDGSDSYSRNKSNLPAIINTGGHFVVATSLVSGNTYNVLDPGSSSTTTMQL